MEVNENKAKIISKENENLEKKLLNLSYEEFKTMGSYKKVRDIPLKENSLSGKIISQKNDSIIEFESSLERDFIYLLEFNNEVCSYCEQPIKLSKDNLFYTPDFYINYFNGKNELIEIKYSTDLLINFEEYQKKFQIARDYCKENNLIFKVLTEVEIRNQYLENAKFLLRFRSNFNVGHQINSSHMHDVNLLMTKINELQESTFTELINQCSKTESKKAELIHILWHLISINDIKVDLNSKLSMNQKIWI